MMGFVISLVFIVILAKLVLNKYNPQASLIFVGIAMMVFAYFVNGVAPLPAAKSTHSIVFDFVEVIKNFLSSRGAGLGLLIMSVGGFAAYMSKIGANESLVYVLIKPVTALKSPYLIAGIVPLLGAFLSLFISSATGLGLLLMASVYPVLIRLGMSKQTAVAVISSTLIFDMGPASGNSLMAAKIAGMDIVDYFMLKQVHVAVPALLVMATLHAFLNRYYDSKMSAEERGDTQTTNIEELKLIAPKFYALLPLLPIVFLIGFSKMFGSPIKINVTTAMLSSLFIAMILELVRTKDIKNVFEGMNTFWAGMGDAFKNVVTLIIAGQTFAQGLKNLGFIDGLVSISQGLGMGAVAITILFAIIILLASTLMGSGNASFFSFGPMVPGIAKDIGANPLEMILPLQMSAGIGRTMSPISGVVIGTSALAGVSPFETARRNVIPMIGAWLTMTFFSFAFVA